MRRASHLAKDISHIGVHGRSAWILQLAQSERPFSENLLLFVLYLLKHLEVLQAFNQVFGEVGDSVSNDFMIDFNDRPVYRNEAGVDSALFLNIDSYIGADGSTRKSPGTPSVVT